MEKSILLVASQFFRKLIFLSVLGGLIFPLLFLVSHFSLQKIYWDPFLIAILRGAFTQTALSLVFTITFGFFGALSLFSLRRSLTEKQFYVLSFLLISPSFIPPIMVVLLIAKSLSYLPTGLEGVVFYHAIMNIGLVSVLLHRQIDKKAKSFARDNLVSGVSCRRFIFRGLLPEMRSDLSLLSFYFFILYFFSFSVPFLVGGSIYGGVEVFIYEKILLFGQWGEAIQYSFYLFVILFLLSKVFEKRENTHFWSSQSLSNYPRKYSPVSFIIGPLFPVVLLFIGLSLLFLNNWWAIDSASWLSLVRGTWFISLVTGILTFLFLTALSYAFLQNTIGRWLLSFVYPGWVILGFAFLLLPGESTLARMLKTSVALSFLYLPFVYRLIFHQVLKDLTFQVKVSSTFPVPWRKIFFNVIFPQVLPSIAFLSALSSLWAAGDFAITGLLINSHSSSTLAYEMKELMANYRLEKALMYMPSLLISSLLLFLLFSGIAYVSRSKNIS